MNLKKLILAGVGVASLAGNAEAITLSVTSIGTVPGAYTDKAPLKVASEVQQGTTLTANDDRDETVAVATFSVESGKFPTGNVIVNASISGATFDAIVSGANLDFKNCKGGVTPTAVISTGGAVGGQSVSWVVSGLDNCGVGENVEMSIPLDLDLGGAAVTLNAGVVTESGSTPVDGGTKTVSSFITTNTPAYSAEIKAAVANATANVSETSGAYKLFLGAVNTATLGTVQLKADNTVAIDISGGITKADIADYATASIVATATPGFGAFLEAAPTDDITLATVSATSKNATTATFSAVQGGAFDAAFTSAAAFAVKTDGDTAIPASTHVIAVTPTLEAGLTGPGNLVVGATSNTAVSSIVRNGTSVKLPWVVSETQAGSSNTGAVNYIRVTNRTAVAFGPITATVLASNNSGSLGKTATLATGLAAGAELLVNSSQLEAAFGVGGNFGRGDIEVTVEGAGATVVQLVARPDGVYTIDNQ